MTGSSVEIPVSTFESLAVVLDLSDEEFTDLLSALGDPGATDLEHVTSTLASAGAGSSVDAAELVGSFAALDRLRSAQGWSKARAAQQIARSDAAPVTSEQEVALLRGRIHALLEAPGLSAPAARGGRSP